MKLLILMPQCDKSEEAIICGLSESGFEVHLVCSEEIASREKIKTSGIEIITRDFGGRFDFASASFVRNMVKDIGIDAIYAPRNNTLGIGVLASLGAKNKLVGYRGTTHHLHWYDVPSLMTYLNSRVDRIVCVSDAVKKYLLGMGLPEKRLTRIYKGHDTRWYSGLKKPSRSELGIPEDCFVVCFAGRIRPVKGCDVLLRAVEMLSAENNVMVLMVGEMADRRVERMLNDGVLKDRVKYLGYRPDAAVVAGACDVFVMPSLKREGLPRAVIEAMAQGVPAIVSDAGGMPELVEDGKSGLIVKAGEARALADAIERMRSDPAFRKKCSIAARERIENHFNIRESIEQYAAMFRSL